MKTQLIAKSWEDIRKKPEKIDNWQEKELQEVLKEAQKVYMRRDEENQKLQAKLLVTTVKEVQRGKVVTGLNDKGQHHLEGIEVMWTYLKNAFTVE